MAGQPFYAGRLQGVGRIRCQPKPKGKHKARTVQVAKWLSVYNAHPAHPVIPKAKGSGCCIGEQQAGIYS